MGRYCYLPKPLCWFGCCPAYVALASSGRVSHTHFRSRCLSRGRNARGISEQRATLDQSLDSCISGFLRCFGCAYWRLDNGWSIRIGTPRALDAAGNAHNCIAPAWLVQSEFLFLSVLQRPSELEEQSV